MMNIDPRKVQLSEKDIEEWIFKNPDLLGISRWVGRQIRLPSGILDLFGLAGQANMPTVIEVKNVPASQGAILQVCRYAEDIKKIMRIAHEDDYGYDPFVQKIVFYPSCNISNELILEADSVGVVLLPFTISIDMVINKQYYWGHNIDFGEYKKQIEYLSSTDQFNFIWSKETEE